MQSTEACGPDRQALATTDEVQASAGRDEETFGEDEQISIGYFQSESN